jgi:hypothetical protein
MKKLAVGIFLLFPVIASAQFHDHDGLLSVNWQPPGVGNTLDHYQWAYIINGVPDSVVGTSAAGDTLENSVALANIGDWAVFKVRAISVVYDTSTWAVSDTAYYNTETGIGPPRGVTWIQGP